MQLDKEFECCEQDLLINTAIDRGEQRRDRDQNCFNSFSARAHVNLANMCASGDQPSINRRRETVKTVSHHSLTALAAINRGVNERATYSSICKPL
jgi:hypothetical protein